MISYKKAKGSGFKSVLITERNERLDKLINHICDSFFVERKEVLGRRRDRGLVIVRQAICLIASEIEYTKGKKEFTQDEIGAHIGYKDHSSVWHGIITIKGDMQNDMILAAKIGELRYSVGKELGVRIKLIRNEFNQEENLESPNEKTYSFLNPSIHIKDIGRGINHV